MAGMVGIPAYLLRTQIGTVGLREHVIEGDHLSGGSDVVAVFVGDVPGKGNVHSRVNEGSRCFGTRGETVHDPAGKGGMLLQNLRDLSIGLPVVYNNR